jgi:hypothetical protein
MSSLAFYNLSNMDYKFNGYMLTLTANFIMYNHSTRIVEWSFAHNRKLVLVPTNNENGNRETPKKKAQFQFCQIEPKEPQFKFDNRRI